VIVILVMKVMFLVPEVMKVMFRIPEVNNTGQFGSRRR